MFIRLAEKIAEAQTPRHALDIMYGWLMDQKQHEAASLVWNEMLLNAKANGFRWLQEDSYEQGHKAGYREGYRLGHEEGYEEGYVHGLTEEDEQLVA